MKYINVIIHTKRDIPGDIEVEERDETGLLKYARMGAAKTVVVETICPSTIDTDGNIKKFSSTSIIDSRTNIQIDTDSYHSWETILEFEKTLKKHIENIESMGKHD